MSSRKSLDSLGDRLKHFEGIETSQTFIPNLPIYVRLDGRSFSKFTQGLDRPFDENFTKLMIETTKHLVKEFHATVGFVQSDEISLVLKHNYKQEAAFAGKKQKLISSLASSASSFFASRLPLFLPSKVGSVPTFDCRAFNVPSEGEATNCILWREQDATKNSIQMLGHHYFSHQQLFKKNTTEIKGMLLDIGINWDAYPNSFKYGSYIQRRTYTNEEGIIRSKVDVIDWFNSLKEFDHSGRVMIVMNDYRGDEEDATEFNTA